MKSKQLKSAPSIAVLVWSVVIVILLANIEAAAQEETSSGQPIIKKSRKTDRKEALREELVELDKLIAREPQNVLAYQIRASHHSELQQYEQAIGDYSRIIGTKPDHLKTYLERARVYQELERYDQAPADLDYVISRAPRHSDTRGHEAYAAVYRRHLIHLQLDESEKAIADLTDILKFRPKDESIYQSRSELYRSTKQYEQAVADYTELIKINSRSTWGYLGRAEVYQITGEPQIFSVNEQMDDLNFSAQY